VIQPMKFKLTYVVILVVLASVLVYAQSMNQQLAYFLVAILMVPLWVHLLMDRNYQRHLVCFLGNSVSFLVAFFLYGAVQISHLSAGVTTHALLFIGGYAYFFLGFFFLIPLVINSDKFDIRRFFVVLGIGLTGIALLGYATGPIQILEERMFTYRAYSTSIGSLPGLQSFLGNPNSYGAIMMISLFSSLSIAFERKSFFNKYTLNSAVLFVGLVFSFARSAYLGFATMAILSFLINKRFRRIILRVLLGGVIILALLVMCHIDMFSWMRPFLQLDKANMRLDLWAASYQVILERPLIGWGEQDLGVLLTRYISPGMAAYGYGPHNTYLRLALSGGIVGFVAIMYICISSLIMSYKGVKKGVKQARWIFPLLGGLLVHVFFEVNTVGGAGTVSLVFTVLLGWSQLLHIKTVTPGKRANEINALQKNV